VRKVLNIAPSQRYTRRPTHSQTTNPGIRSTNLCAPGDRQGVVEQSRHPTIPSEAGVATQILAWSDRSTASSPRGEARRLAGYGTSGPGSVVSILKMPAADFLCSPARCPAIAVMGDPFSAKRCFAFGYFLPVNSKKADAGMRHRLLLSKCRPSDRKLNTGPPRGPDGGKLKFIGTSSIPLPAAGITGRRARFAASECGAPAPASSRSIRPSE
jgi:hypothetical protein